MLTVNIFPENATKREVEWNSYNSEIAAVDSNGKVTAKKAGKCTVYAEIKEDGREFKRQCKVTVVDEIAPVASITLLEKQTLTVGTTVPLIAVVKPDNAEQGLVWSSSDPEIATVSEGFVWGKKKGTCTITVKSRALDCSITKECKITVEGPKFPVTLAQPTNGRIAIEGHGTETSITVEQGTTLTVTVTPDEGYKLKSLTAGDEDITNTKQFTVKAATEVKAVFESKQGDNNKPGAVEDALLAGIAVAPNPFDAQLRILNPEGVVARYEVVNASGVVVRSGALSDKEVVVDTETLPAGVYFVHLEAQNGARKSVMVSK